MNAGNMGIPLAFFAFGQAGLQRATLMFVIITFLQYSLGIYILHGRGNWTRKFSFAVDLRRHRRSFVNLAQVKIPELLLQPVVMLGQATIPIMLISLGYRLHEVESLQWGHALGGALVRIFGGFAAANIAVNLIGAEGVNRQVLLLYGALRMVRSRRRDQFHLDRKVPPRSRSRRVNCGHQHFHFGSNHSRGLLVDPLNNI